MPRQRLSLSARTARRGAPCFKSRVALFWKVIFFITLLSSGLGALGMIAKPGVDFLIALGATAQAGIFWLLCRRGKRSIRFSRAVETGGLLLNLTIGGFLGRYLLAGFVRIMRS